MGFFTDRRVVVTGASGLLGTHLVHDLLDAGAFVRAIVHKRPFATRHPALEIMQADLTQEADCNRAMSSADTVCLCASITVGAAQAVKNPMIAVTSNLVMAARSLQAACLAGVKRVLVVSRSEEHTSE